MNKKILEKFIEKFIEKFLLFCAIFSILLIFLIIIILFSESLPFFQKINIFEFLFSTQWNPTENANKYGVIPLLTGTLLIVIFSSIISIPFGLGAAIFISEYANKKSAKIFKPLLELLAGIPSVVYGFFALKYITPFIKLIFPSTNIFNALSASIAVGIMIIPTIASISEDSLRSVPKYLREAGYSLGLNKSEVTKGIVLPTAISGIIASFILGISRAIGETMIVTIAAGATPILTLNPLDSIQTMTGYIINTIQGEVVYGSLEYRTIYAVALLLFFITLFLNYIAKKIIKCFNRY